MECIYLLECTHISCHDTEDEEALCIVTDA